MTIYDEDGKQLRTITLSMQSGSPICMPVTQEPTEEKQQQQHQQQQIDQQEEKPKEEETVEKPKKRRFGKRKQKAAPTSPKQNRKPDAMHCITRFPRPKLRNMPGMQNPKSSVQKEDS